MPHDIFISYSRRDLAAVKPIKEALEAAGFSCWMDLDGIESGDENFKRKIVPALDRCSFVLFFISAYSQKSEWTVKELGYAKRHGKRVVPLRFNDDLLVGEFDFDYGDANIIDWRKPEQRDKLILDLRRWNGAVATAAAVPLDGQTPKQDAPVPPPIPKPPSPPTVPAGNEKRSPLGWIGWVAIPAVVVLLFWAAVFVLVLLPGANDDEPAPAPPPAASEKPSSPPVPSPESSAGRATEVGTPSTAHPAPSGSGPSDFAADVTIDDVYRPERRAPVPAPAPAWDEEDRFVARRDAALQLRAFAEWLAEGTNGLARPVADADGTVRIGPEEIMATADIQALQGARKVILDGGELLFSRPTAELARFHAEATDVASRAEAGTAADEEVRDWPAERMAKRLSDSDSVFSLSIEIGPGGGWITCRRKRTSSVLESSESVVLGDIFPGPAGAGRAVAAGIRFSAKGFERAPVVSGCYSVWTVPDTSNKRERPLYCHDGCLTGVQCPPSWRRNVPPRSGIEALNGLCRAISGVLGEALDPVPDENGDVVVPRGKTLLVGDVPDDGTVKRIVLRGGKISFDPSRAEMRKTLDRLFAAVSNAHRPSDVPPDEELFAPPIPVQSLAVPVFVGKEGGNISGKSLFVEETRLLSPVSNEFGERPEMRIVGGVLVDPVHFSRKIGMLGWDLVASSVNGKSIVQSSQSDKTYWLCDFSGPFPRRLSRAELYALDHPSSASATAAPSTPTSEAELADLRAAPTLRP